MMEQKLKAEQACRGVSRETGWGIIAKSPGFTAKNAKNLSAAFNDAMHPVIAKMGQSIFSCKMSGGDVLLGVSTKRAGADGRAYLFTHARVLPEKTYREIMAADPGFVRGLKFAEFLTDNPHSGVLAAAGFTIEKPDAEDPRTDGGTGGKAGGPHLNPGRENGGTGGKAGGPHLAPGRENNGTNLRSDAGETARKYGIGRDALAELYYDAYLSLLSGQTLCFETDVSNDRTDQAMERIEDMVYLAALGLPPGMRGGITFSSGRDNSCRFCVQSREGGAWLRKGRKALHFQMNPEKRPLFQTEIRSVTSDRDLLRRMCRDLAYMTPGQRKALLDFTDAQCAGASGARPAYTESVVLSAYYLYVHDRGGAVSAIEALFLILLLLNDLKRGAIRTPDDRRINRWLAVFLEIVSAAELCPNVTMMQGLLERAFAENEGQRGSAQPDSGLWAASMRALQHADRAGAYALAGALKKENAGSIRRKTIEALLGKANRLPGNAPGDNTPGNVTENQNPVHPS